MQDELSNCACGGKAERKHNMSPAQWVECQTCGYTVEGWGYAWNTISALRAENERLRVRVAELEIAGHCLAPVLKLAADPRIPRQRCDLSLERPAKTFLAVLGEQL